MSVTMPVVALAPAPAPDLGRLHAPTARFACGVVVLTLALVLTGALAPGAASAQPRQAPPPIQGTGPAPTPTVVSELPPVPQPPAAPAAPAPTRATGDEAAILDAINTLRAATSLGPLLLQSGLMNAARQHSAEMAQASTLAHVSPTTGTPADRAAAAGVRALRVTQNISRRPSATAAHEAILASEAHRAQLLDPSATHIGIGVAEGADGVYLTELMARMVPEPELPPPSVADVAQPSIATPALAEPSGPTPQPVAPVPPVAADPEPQPRAQPAQAQTPTPPQAQAQAGGTLPTLRITRAHRGVAGYWLFHQGRWWYFPIPPGTRNGQLIYPDTRVQGAPPGYQGTAPQAQTQAPARVQPPVTTAPRGYWRLTPQ